jgi:hypothetical protein
LEKHFLFSFCSEIPDVKIFFLPPNLEKGDWFPAIQLAYVYFNWFCLSLEICGMDVAEILA